MINLLFPSGKFLTLRKGIVNLPLAIFSVMLVSLLSGSMFFGHNIYGSVMAKISAIKVARQLAANEMDRIRAVSYDDVSKEELAKIDSTGSFYREIVLGKEYREDIGNTVMKHKPVTLNIYGSPDSLFPLVSVKIEKVSRWYKSGSFDKSDGGIYDETGEQHKGTIKKTGKGTGYVFLKKDARVNGDVEIYDETNGDVYIYNSIGTPSGKTVIRHIGPSTSSGYIRLTESCSVSGTVILENSSNGGMIIDTALKDGTKVSKLGTGTGYLRLAKGCSLGTDVSVTNNSSGAIVVNGTLENLSVLTRNGSSDGLLIVNGRVRGNVGIDMEESGKFYMNGTFYDGTKVAYKSASNKSLTLNGSKVSGSSYFVNDSSGNVEFTGTISDGGSFIVSGSGNGKTFMGGKVEGTAYIINDTSGYISVSSRITIRDGKTIRKIGGGSGYLELSFADLRGSFTLDSDWYGQFVSEGGTDPGMQALRYPVIYDGVYVYARGKGLGRLRFSWGLDVLGRVNIDVSGSPKSSWNAGNYNNPQSGNVSQVLRDGYTYKI